MHPFLQEFHEMSHGLLLWLENIDRRRNQVGTLPPKADRGTLRTHHKTLTVGLAATVALWITTLVFIGTILVFYTKLCS